MTTETLTRCGGYIGGVGGMKMGIKVPKSADVGWFWYSTINKGGRTMMMTVSSGRGNPPPRAEAHPTSPCDEDDGSNRAWMQWYNHVSARAPLSSSLSMPPPPPPPPPIGGGACNSPGRCADTRRVVCPTGRPITLPAPAPPSPLPSPSLLYRTVRTRLIVVLFHRIFLQTHYVA